MCNINFKNSEKLLISSRIISLYHIVFTRVVQNILKNVTMFHETNVVLLSIMLFLSIRACSCAHTHTHTTKDIVIYFKEI